ncbi:hypothetical protein [Pyxidicoccus caerfyrddinensis]|jgi:hypothetical protein|nr:hypothetical protein [Pyxidicoccus caerfyrddinensis]
MELSSPEALKGLELVLGLRVIGFGPLLLLAVLEPGAASGRGPG